MYNEEFKQKYISYCRDVEGKSTASINLIKRTFDIIEHYEQKLKKDLHTMDHNELFDLFHYYKIYNATTIRTYHSVLKSYISWCMIGNGLKINLLKVIVTPTIIIASLPDKEVKGKYFNIDDLEKYKERVRLAYDEKVATYIITMVELAHQCICRELVDIINLRYSEIDFDRKLIYGKSVNDELLTLLKETYSINEFDFTRRHDNLNCRVHEDSIFKFTSRDKDITKYRKFFQGLMNKLRMIAGIQLTLDSIFQCGLIHFVYQKYCEAGYENFIEDLKNSIRDFEISNWIAQKSTMSVVTFRSKYLQVIKYCI